MPLNASMMVLNGHLRSADIRGFYELLTGSMTDQPVTITNSVTAQSFIFGPRPAQQSGTPTLVVGLGATGGVQQLWPASAVVNGGLPSGGTMGQVLTRGSGTSLVWSTPAAVPTQYWTLSGNVLAPSSSWGVWAQDYGLYKLHGAAHVRTGTVSFGTIQVGQGTQVWVWFATPMPNVPSVVMLTPRLLGDQPKSIVQVGAPALAGGYNPTTALGFQAHCQNLGEQATNVTADYLAYWNEP